MREDPVRVLLVENEPNGHCLPQLLESDGMEVEQVQEQPPALHPIRGETPDVVVLDMNLPHAGRLELLQRSREVYGDVPVVLVAPCSDLREAVESIKAGAFDYLPWPFNNGEFFLALRRARSEHVRRGAGRAGPAREQRWSLPQSMGGSAKIRRLAAEVARVAVTNFSVVILGETGAGKELVARAIHVQSHRAAAGFLAVDCGAIPDSLIENELLGHERGAFTGADRTTMGKFEAASGGTLFLDEISNLPLGMQSKLLRVLQEKQVYRIGGIAAIKTDVRVIVASNQDLQAQVQSKAFRGDLFHRLSEYILHVPPLRERREDILYLAEQMLHYTNLELGKEVRGFSDAAVQTLLGCDWPGNVRELRNVIRGAVLLADETVAPQHLRLLGDLVKEPSAVDVPAEGLSLKRIVQLKTAHIERAVLRQTLRRTRGNRAKAARMLSIDYKTIRSKIRQYGIEEAIDDDATKE